MYSSGTLTGRFAPRLPARALGEQRLARMAARGEQHAFEALFERYHRELYRYCRVVLGESEEAEDALQNTMTAALRHLPQLERRSSLRGWLYRVAHNEAISIMRRRPAPLDPDEAAASTVPGVDVTFEERERLRQLVADLRALPERQRGALVMRELSDLSYSQIAAAMGTSEAGARQLVYEARESLRALDLGRRLDCEAARRVISERDGRMLRGRRLRAHLRACEPCREFRAAIATRRTDLAALFPPLAPAAASGLLASVFGEAGGGAASGTAAGATTVAGGGGAALGGAGLKAASIVSVVALGAGAVGVSQEVGTPFGAIGDEPGASPVAAAPAPVSTATATPGGSPAATGAAARPGAASQRTSSAPARGGEGSAGRAGREAGSSRPGEAGTAPAVEGAPANPPAHSQAIAPPHSGTAPAGESAPPGEGATGQPADGPSGGNSGAATEGGPQDGPTTSFSTPQLPPDKALPSASTRGVPHETKFEGGTS